MKVTIEFNLPEDEQEYTDSVNGYKYAVALYEYDNWLRGLIKYGDLIAESEEIYQDCRDRLRNIIIENGAEGAIE